MPTPHSTRHSDSTPFLHILLQTVATTPVLGAVHLLMCRSLLRLFSLTFYLRPLICMYFWSLSKERYTYSMWSAVVKKLCRYTPGQIIVSQFMITGIFLQLWGTLSPHFTETKETCTLHSIHQSMDICGCSLWKFEKANQTSQILNLNLLAFRQVLPLATETDAKTGVEATFVFQGL